MITLRYNSDEHIINFKKTGQYPKIHDDIIKLGSEVPSKVVMDLGCSIGLLSHRLSNTNDLVLAIEPSREALAKTIPKENIRYYNFKIQQNTLKDIALLIRKYNVDTIYARRVISEIYTTGGYSLVYALSDVFYKANIKHIILEGRVESSRSVHKIKNTDKEIELFSKNFKVYKRYKNCAILIRK